MIEQFVKALFKAFYWKGYNDAIAQKAPSDAADWLEGMLKHPEMLLDAREIGFEPTMEDMIGETYEPEK